MPDPFQTYSPVSFAAITERIFSRASGGGRKRCNSPDGRRISQYGQEVVPANPSPVQVKDSDSTIHAACYGLNSFGSSRSAALNLSLGSRLRQLLDTGGSIEYRQTWREKATPSGTRYWGHTASARRIKDSGCTGEQRGWATPQAKESGRKAGKHDCTGHFAQNQLSVQVQMVKGGPTPTVQDSENRSNPSQLLRRTQPLSSVAGWVTPSVSQPGGNIERFLQRKRDAIAKGSRMGVSVSDLGMQAQQISGPNPDLSSAQKRNGAGYQLNPLFSLWLMGYPEEWLNCVDWETRSSRK